MERATDIWERLIAVGAVALKAGTEAEKQTCTDILWMSRTVPAASEVRVKVSGPEDCAGLKSLFVMGFRSFIAPMIESPFAVKKFLMACEWVSGGRAETMDLCLNLESVCAHHNMHDILTCPEAGPVRKINIGRTDLALSMGATPEDRTVIRMAAEMIAAAKSEGKVTGLGGSICTETIEQVIAAIQPDEVETRHVIFETCRMKDPFASILCALEFEKWLLEKEAANWQWMSSDLAKRSISLDKRMGINSLHAA